MGMLYTYVMYIYSCAYCMYMLLCVGMCCMCSCLLYVCACVGDVYFVFFCVWLYSAFFLSDTCVFVHVACAFLYVNMCTFIWVRAEVVTTE